MYPLVFILDLDGTLIGNVKYLALENALMEKFNIEYEKKYIRSDLKTRLLRPYFKVFFNNIQKRYPNSEFFIYTSSTEKWAKIVINNIEKIMNIKFNRPIFSRKNCVYDKNSNIYTKDINLINNIVFNRIKNKYNITKPSEVNYYVVDNSHSVYKNSNKNFLIECPDYEYIKHVNFLRKFPKKMLDTYYPTIFNYLTKNYGIPKIDTTNKSRALLTYKKFLRNLHENIVKHNIECCNDHYWLNLNRIINGMNLNIDNHLNIKTINNKICNTY